MTPNIMQAVKNVYTEGDPMDYTWVDLGDFGSLDDDAYDKAMRDLPDLFASDPADLMLPFEQMGIVRFRDDFKNGNPLSITIERTGGELIVRLRGKEGDRGSIRCTGKEHFVSLPPDATAESYIQGLKNNGLECSTDGLTPERYIFEIWSATVRMQYAEYMRRAMDMHERTRVYKPIASPSNSKRIRKGKHPLFEWKVIDVTARPEDHDIVATGNGRSSPRQHKRRGHFRQYKDGRRTWIPEALVGKIEFGYIYHSYTATQQRRK